MPKGVVGPEEDLQTAALREVLEETGYQCEILQELTTKPHYRTSDSHGSVWKTLHLFLMRAIEQAQEPDWENDAFRWVPLNKALSYTAKTELPPITEAIEILQDRK